MEELQFRLNTLLAANDYPVLFDYPGALRKKAEKHALGELKKFKALQTRPKPKQVRSPKPKP
ncbi:MAG: hypothetical protein JW395_0153 [Nitrospira sp.]|nr:hypothetical protein [Nitrospira sp.]